MELGVTAGHGLLYDVPLHNTGEHLEETGLQSLMSAWQANSVPDISAGLKDLANRVNQMIARNG